MPPLITLLVLVCLVLCGTLAVIEAVRTRSWTRFLVEGFLLVGYTAVLGATKGFHLVSGDRPFGPGSGSLVIIALLFLCIALGMAARYLFTLNRPFSWLHFLRPLCVSPIILLPLLGTLQTAGTIDAIPLISLCILGFQNGFFWRVIYERSAP